MLVTHEQAKEIVKDCKLVAEKATHGYGGTKFADVRTFSNNKYGSGYSVTVGRKTSFYVFNNTVIDRKVYEGEYSVADACMTANNVIYVRYGDIRVTPIWQLELDTITGSYEFKRTEEFKPSTLAGRTLTLCWLGPVTNKALRAKIRRRMRLAVNSGKATIKE